MSHIPFVSLSRSLRIPLTLGAALAAVAVGGSAWAEEATPAAAPDPAEEATPAVTPGPTDELGFVYVIGATTAGEQLQWVDPAEAAKPDKAKLPEISADDWLPAPQD
jgi:hypothetical protein